MSQSPFVARNIRYGITLGTEPKVHIVYVYVIKEHESQSIVIITYLTSMYQSMSEKLATEFLFIYSCPLFFHYLLQSVSVIEYTRGLLLKYNP